MTDNRYLLFGLRVQSAREISSLIVSEAPFDSDPDVEIVEGEVPLPEGTQDIDGLKVKVERDNCFLGIEECGRFQLIGGRRIVIDADPNATAEQVNLYLLGSVFGALLHQRSLLPFHCNAVEVDGSVFLFCGDSGAGKSTLAAHFVDRGFRLLADDLCALHFADGRLVAAPGVARLKLWQDTLEVFRRSSAGLRLVPWYDDKFEVPFKGKDWQAAIPVAGIYHLRRAESGRNPGIHPLKGLQAANAVTANIYRRRLGDLIGRGPSYLAATARIIERIPIFSMNRNWGFAHFLNDALAVEDHMRELARKSGSVAGKSAGSRPFRNPAQA